MIWNMVQTARTCVVTFKSSVDESVLYTVEVDAGSSVTYGGKTPTKSSTAQYTYTFSGWSRTKGGNAVSGILNDIEDDITLWSAFTSTVRKYTITWKNYDGTTLSTTSVAYGSVPSYAGTPSYNGWTFTGWNPTPKAVTGAATYTATYSLPNGMSETIAKDWDQIIADSKNNNISSYSAGQTRMMITTDKNPLCFEIAGIDQDTAGHFAFISKTIDGETLWSNTGQNTGGYPSSNYKAYLESTSLNHIPSNIKSAMKTVTKYCHSYSPNNHNMSYSAKIWPPNKRELYDNVSFVTQGPQYYFYKTYSNRIRYKVDGSVASFWWLADAGNIISNATYVGETGAAYNTGSVMSSRGAVPGFVL